jgi:hypothetical protein
MGPIPHYVLVIQEAVHRMHSGKVSVISIQRVVQSAQAWPVQIIAK